MKAQRKYEDSPIGQIQPFLIFQFRVPRCTSHRLFQPVLPPTVYPYRQHDDHHGAPAHDDRDLRWDIPRRVLWSESLGPDDVARAIRDEVECRDGGFLRVAGDIRPDEGEECDERGGRGLGEVVSRQAAAVVVEGEANDQGHSDYS